MASSQFLKFIRRLFTGNSDAAEPASILPAPVRRTRNLRLMQLEDRRVLNGAMAVTGAQAAAFNFDGGSLTVTGHNGQMNLGAGNVDVVDVTLSQGTWSINDAGNLLSANQFLVDGQTLHLDKSLFANGQMLETLQFRGGNATSETLILNLANGDFISDGGVDFQGGEGAGDNDTLEVNGYNVASMSVSHTGPESGSLDMTGVGSVSFSQIEPLVLGGTAANLVINLPAGADATVVLSDDGGPADPDGVQDAGFSAIDGLFEYTQFANPTNSLTINDPSGAKTIAVRGLDAAFNASLTLNDGDALDNNVVNFDTNNTDLGTNKDLTVNALTINVNRSIFTDGGDLQFNARGAVTSDANGDIFTRGVVGAVDAGTVDINAGADVQLAGDINAFGAGAAGNGGLVTIDSTAGSITAADINAQGAAAGAGANILLTAAGTNSDILVNGALQTNTAGLVTLTADDSIRLAAGSSITSAAGNVLLRANNAATNGDGNDGITMDAGTSITTGTGTITLRSDGANGGDIIAQTLSTQNAVVTINSGEDVTLQNTITTRRGNVDIDAVQGVTSTAAAVISTTGTVANDNSGTVDIDAAGAVNLAGNITTAGFGGTSNGGLVTIDSTANSVTVAGINAQGAAAGAGANILLTAAGQNSDILVNAALLTNTAGVVTLTADDSIRLAAGSSITTATGNVLLRANNVATAGNGQASTDADGITMDAGTSITTGTGTITLRSDGANGGDIIAQTLSTQNAVVTINSGEDVTLQNTITTRRGNVDIDAVQGVTSTAAAVISTTGTANNDNSGTVDIDAGGAVNLAGNITTAGFGGNSNGGLVTIDSTANSVTVAAINALGTGAGAGANILLTAAGTNSDILVNGALQTNTAGLVTLTADDSIRLAAGSSITTATGNVLLRANNVATAGNGQASTDADGITMDAGTSITTATGTITLRSDGANGGDIIAQTLSTQNAVVTINSGEDVTLQNTITTRRGNVDIDAVQGVTSTAAAVISTTGTANNDNSGTVDIDAAGAVNLAGNITTAGFGGTSNGGLVTIDSTANSVTVAGINAQGAAAGAGANILLTAAGQNSDILVNGALQTNTAGLVTLTADDSIRLAAGSSITSAAGNVLLRANNVATAGNGQASTDADGITMDAGTSITTGTGTITLRSDGANGGDIIAQTLSTQNAVVTINSGEDVTLQSTITTRRGNVDIDAVQGVTSTAAAVISTTGTANNDNSGTVDIDAGGAVNLAGNITTAGFGGNSNGGLVTIDSTANSVTVAAINALGTGAGAGANILLTAAGTNSDILVNGALQTNTAGLVTLTADDSIRLAAGSSITTAAGNVLLRANNVATAGNGQASTDADGITMDAGTSITTGTGTITLRSDGANGGDIIAQTLSTQNAVVTINSGEDVTLQNTITTRRGNVDIDAVQGVTSTAAAVISTTGTANNDNSGTVDIDTGGAVNLVGNITTAGFGGTSNGGLVTIDSTANSVTVAGINAQGAAAGAGANILLTAAGQNSDILVNGALLTNTVGLVTLTADDSIRLAAGSSITTATGNVLLRANNTNTNGDGNDGITMDAGTSITTATGTITLRSDGANGGDIIAQTLSTQNAVVTINSGEEVTLQNTITTRRGNVDIDAVQGVTSTAAAVISTTGTVANDNSGTVDIDAGGAVNLAGNITTAGFGGNSNGGLVTIDSTANSVTVAAINALGTGAGAGANILLTAAGTNSDILVNGTLQTNTAGVVTLTADDSIRLAAGSSITTATGNVLLRANNVATAGNGQASTDADGITMDAGTSITTATGTITLRSDGANGGDIIAQTLSTQNAVVTINSGEDVTLQNTITTRRGNVDIDAVQGVTSTAAAIISTTGTAANDNSGTVDIDAGGAVNLAGNITTAGFAGTSNGGLVTIDSTANSVTVAGINTSGPGGSGNILIRSGGFLTMNQQVNSGSANTGLIAFGDISLGASGLIIANQLGVRQLATALAGSNDVDSNGTYDVNLGGSTTITRNNDVNLFAALNQFTVVNLADRSGDIFFNDIDGLNVGTIGATVGVITSGDNSQISIIAGGTLNILNNIQAENIENIPTVDNNTSPGEIIRLLSVDGDIVIANGVTISTDQNTIAGQSSTITRDVIQIEADSDKNAPLADTNNDGILDAGELAAATQGKVTFGNGVQLRTDGGVANRFYDRVLPGGPGTSFFTWSGVPFGSAVARSGTDFIVTFTVTINSPLEENLRMNIDWRDPTGIRTQSLDFLTPGIQSVSHLYTFSDFKAFVDAANNTFLVDFSVSHHQSIQVLGGIVAQGVAPAIVVPGGVLTTTDNPRTPPAIPPIPPGLTTTQIVTSNDFSNRDFHFEDGLVEIKIPTLFLAPITPDPAPPVPLPTPAQAPPLPLPLLVMNTVTDPPEFPGGSYSTQSADFFQLRHVNDAAPNEPAEVIKGFEHIDDNEGELLLQPKQLKEWVRKINSPEVEGQLNGPGYELWLITEKVRNGQPVTISRPVLKFSVFDDQPFPESEPLPADQEFPELKLMPMDEGDEDARDSEPVSEESNAPAADPASPENLQSSINNRTSQLEHDIESPDYSGSGMAQSAMAGATMATLLAGRENRLQAVSKSSLLLNTLLRRRSQQNPRDTELN